MALLPTRFRFDLELFKQLVPVFLCHGSPCLLKLLDSLVIQCDQLMLTLGLHRPQKEAHRACKSFHAHKVWLLAEPDLTHIIHDPLPAIAHELPKDAPLRTVCQKAVLLLADPFDEYALVVAARRRHVALDETICALLPLPSHDLVIGHVGEEEVSAADGIAHVALRAECLSVEAFCQLDEGEVSVGLLSVLMASIDGLEADADVVVVDEQL